MQYACPPGTYGDRVKLVVISDCKDCPAGYLCSDSAISNNTLQNYTCPAGKYCPIRTLVPTDCPPGTYRSLTGGRKEADCTPCPVGYYCEKGAINPVRCAAGTHCPAKSGYFNTCRGGYYCNAMTNFTETICPQNYYCPRGSTQPIKCTGRYICPEQSEIPQICEAGTIVKEGGKGSTNYCLDCAPGSYSTLNDVQCQNCSAGFMCYGRTNKRYPISALEHRGEICPKGYYCPESSYSATPCPKGTYNQDLGASSLAQCLLCPTNTFNEKTGQSGCRPCGAFASSVEGASTCECFGNFRAFSHADSSCRCMSGYDYIDPITGASKGKESGVENCSPLVFDRCDGANQTRSASGACVSVSDCAKACDGGNGTRSQTLGVCTCDDKPNVDLVCNQNCRSNANSMEYQNGTQVEIRYRNATSGKTESTSVDLNSVGDVYGGVTCEGADKCDIKTTEMSPKGGFYGKYGTPSLVDNAVKRLRMLQGQGKGRILSANDDFQEDYRNLIAEVDYTKSALKNPVICLQRDTSLLFTIRDPRHYPVYLKDSVMNSNPSFDYGAFLILADQMKTKQAYNLTRPSLFAFTFSVQGSYVFVDSSDAEQLMIVRVAGAGESCPDPDRYIQPLSAEAVASSGISQKTDLIIKPDVPLLIGMGTILVVSIFTVMVGVAYCLHKGWSLPKVQIQGYRSLQLSQVDLDHTKIEKFSEEPDCKKDELKEMEDQSVESEDDPDELNLNLQLDLLSAGKEYLSIFGDKKEKRMQEKKKRKNEVVKLMSEIEQLINTIGSDAMVQGMQLFDEENGGADDDINGSKSRSPTKKKGMGENGQDQQQQLQDDKDEQQARLDEERKKKMMQEWSNRDRGLLEKAKAEAQETLNRLKKDLNKNILDVNANQPFGAAADVPAIAVYDNDADSRHNQLVRQIEADPTLTEAEKEALLRGHNQSLTHIDDMMDAERRKQESELEKAIKERAEKRKKALEAKYKKEINKDIKEGELQIKEDIELRKVERSRDIDQDIDRRISDAAEGDKGSYRRAVDELKKERNERKAEMENMLNKEQEERMSNLKEEVMRRWTAEKVSTDADLEAILMGQQPDTDQAMQLLKEQKEAEEAKLKERLEARRKKLKDDLKSKKEEIQHEMHVTDPLNEEELEKKRQSALSQNNNRNIQHDHSQSVLSLDTVAAAAAGTPDSAQSLFHKLLAQIDLQSAQTPSHLLELLRAEGADPELIARLLKEQEAQQDSRLQQRRELLQQRRALRKQQELEKQKLDGQLKIMDQEDNERADIQKDYIKKMFKEAEKQQNQEGGAINYQERLVVFNEFASDAMLKRLSNLLMKQYIEKEATLKLLVQKYMDARLIEKTNIKKQFKSEQDRLTSLKTLDPELLKEAQKSLRLKEENMLRDVDLQLERAHREEEIKIRGELDARHSEEQIELRRREMEEQFGMKRELIGGGGEAAAKKEEEIERIQMRAYEEAKKREMERKARSLAMHKQDVLKQIDQDLKNKYSDYEELLKRKREEQALLEDQTTSIRKRLAERRKYLREKEQFSEADRKNLLEKHQLYLQTLDSVYEEERRRQQLMMQKRMQQKKVKMEKAAQMKAKIDVQDVDTIKSKLGGGKDSLQIDFGMIDIDEQRDNELIKRLREWTRQRHEYKLAEEQRLLSETHLELDTVSMRKLILKLDNLEKGLKELKRIESILASQPGYVRGQGILGLTSPIERKQSLTKQFKKDGGVSTPSSKPSLILNNTLGSAMSGGNQFDNQAIFNQKAAEVVSKFGTSPNAKQEQQNSAQKNPFSKVMPAEEVKQVISPSSAQGAGVSGGLHKSFQMRQSPKAQPEPPKGPHGNMDEYKNFKKFAKKR